MREIKFRVWDNEKGAMFLVANGYANGDDPNYKDYNEVIEDGWENYILMQYTGFKDCLKNEIYENDVVMVNNIIATVCYDEDQPGFTLIVNPEYSTSINDDFVDQAWCNFYPKLILVIGNIYENPELLNDNQTQS